MARTTKKRISIETAEQADGSLDSITSAYDVIGYKETKYRQKTFAEYQSFLRSLDLLELHDEAYTCAVPPNASAEQTISRLEEKYLRENPKERAAYHDRKAKASARKLSLDEQVEVILSRGR